MWKIKHIFDGEYGCEEPVPGAKAKVSVTLINEQGEIKRISAEDDWLTEMGLDEGEIWPETIEIPDNPKRIESPEPEYSPEPAYKSEPVYKSAPVFSSEYVEKPGHMDKSMPVGEENLHHGRYNEPGPDGSDVYGAARKAHEHMQKIKRK